MIRQIVEPLLEEAGKATTTSAPTTIEKLVTHGAYLIGFAIPTGVILRVTAKAPGIGVGVITEATFALALGTLLFLVWAVRYRAVRPEPWFASHMAWIALTFSMFALYAMAGLIFLAIGFLLTGIATIFAWVAVYGPMVWGLGCLIWVTWRCGRGYYRYLKGEAAPF